MQKHPLSEFKNNRLLVSPSVLACDFARLGAQLEEADGVAGRSSDPRGISGHPWGPSIASP